MPTPRLHIFVRDTATRENYTQRSAGGGDGKKSPSRQRKVHADKLIADLQSAWEEAKTRKDESSAIGLGTADGVCLQFRSDPDFELALESLDLKSQGIELLSVHSEEECQIAAVFIPDDKVASFLKKFQAYADEDDRFGKPKNRTLVDSIADLKVATLRSLWTDEDSLFPSDTKEIIWWEVWLRDVATIPALSNTSLDRFREFAGRAEIKVNSETVRFLDRIVILALADAATLASSIEVLGSIAELRRAKDSPVFFTTLKNMDQVDWAKDLIKRTKWPAENSPAVCILDTGVNRNHLLLEDALAVDDCHSHDPSLGTDDRDGHGTGMAGVALFGDLTTVLTQSGPIELSHRLESVKILQRSGDNVAPRLYAAITNTSVSAVEIQAPLRPRVFSMAVTGPDNRDRGRPSSWSAEIDALSAGIGSEVPQKRLFVISAGNALDLPSSDYFTDAMTEGIYDPGQSWNALTIGAFTQKYDLDEPIFKEWAPLAVPGDLTPGTSTSCLWTKTSWPIKPECVFEGGNMAVSTDGKTDYAASLETLTTHHLPMVRHFTTTGQTSAATSEASRMAAIIQSRYPDSWPETVRGLIVHSSRWTKAMTDRFDDSNKTSIESLLRCYGYGVPDVARALKSASNSLTLIAQDHLYPFENDATKEMAIHKLPWPTSVLEEMGETQVQLRVTLSYFIEPNPAERGWTTRHRYASHGFRFDVKTPIESLEDFRKRINKQCLMEGEKPQSQSDAEDWTVGPTLRHKGSIHSDIWRGTAAKLAERAYIAVYPVIGWWRERHKLGRWKQGARYSLIVSLETARTDIDLYIPVANLVGIAIEN